MPLPFIIGAVAAIAITTIVVLVLLKWKRIVSWFQQRASIVNDEEKDAIAFTIKEELANGQYEVVQGIYDKNTDTVEDAVKYKAENLDEQTAQTLSGSKLKVFT